MAKYFKYFLLGDLLHEMLLWIAVSLSNLSMCTYWLTLRVVCDPITGYRNTKSSHFILKLLITNYFVQVRFNCSEYNARAEKQYLQVKWRSDFNYKMSLNCRSVKLLLCFLIKPVSSVSALHFLKKTTQLNYVPAIIGQAESTNMNKAQNLFFLFT